MFPDDTVDAAIIFNCHGLVAENMSKKMTGFTRVNRHTIH